METESSLPPSKEPAICPYPGPDKSNNTIRKGVLTEKTVLLILTYLRMFLFQVSVHKPAILTRALCSLLIPSSIIQLF
jgi:hypothetical protein